MKQSLKVLFFGNERLATGIESSPLVLSALLDSPHKPVGLVVHSSGVVSRRSKTEPIVELAKAHNLPVHNPTNLKDYKDELATLGADIGVLVAYGKIIPKEIIDIFPLGIINLHPSMLPELRGSTPIETALLLGLEQTGVTIMGLVPEMDAGPIYAQKAAAIDPDASKQTLSDDLHTLGASMIIETLGSIAKNSVTSVDQDESKATFTKRITKQDGVINWENPALDIERQIKAYAGWPKTKTTLGIMEVEVIKAHSVPSNDPSKKPGDLEIVDDMGVLTVETGEGYICIDIIKPVGKKEMPISAFLNGYRQKLA